MSLQRRVKVVVKHLACRGAFEGDVIALGDGWSDVLQRGATCNKKRLMGSGDGSVGKAVASDTRGPQFESQHRKVFIEYCLLSTVNCIEKMKIKKKWTGVAHIF